MPDPTILIPGLIADVVAVATALRDALTAQVPPTWARLAPGGAP